jgi:hypothetical protein
MHICLLDLGCWHDWWCYGMPMRIHWGQPIHNNDRYITVLSGAWRSRRVWGEEVPVPMNDAGQPVQVPVPIVTRRCRHMAASGPLLKMICDRCGALPVVAWSA